MGLIEIKCLKCGKTVEIDRSLIGQWFSCPECKAPFEVKENISLNTYDESHNMNTSHDSSTNVEKSCLDTQQKSFDSYQQHKFFSDLINHSIKQYKLISICKEFGHLLYLNQKEHLKRMFSHFSYIFAFIAFFFFLLWFFGVHCELLSNYTYPICSLFPRIDCEKYFGILGGKYIYTYSNFMAMVSGLLYFSLTFGMLWCLSFNDKFSIYGGEYLWLFTLIRLPHLPYTSLYSYDDFMVIQTYQLSSFFCWCMNSAFILPFILIVSKIYFSKDKQTILVRLVGSLLFNFMFTITPIVVVVVFCLYFI